VPSQIPWVDRCRIRAARRLHPMLPPSLYPVEDDAGQAAGSHKSCIGVRRGELFQVPPPTPGKGGTVGGRCRDRTCASHWLGLGLASQPLTTRATFLSGGRRTRTPRSYPSPVFKTGCQPFSGALQRAPNATRQPSDGLDDRRAGRTTRSVDVADPDCTRFRRAQHPPSGGVVGPRIELSGAGGLGRSSTELTLVAP
jgi:hypothetical protein